VADEKVVATNRKARHEYEVLETFEAGLVLRGTEVKSLREGHVNFKDSYVAFQNSELVFVLAIEKLLGLEIPPKASYMRTLLCELNRIHSHLIWLGTSALDL